MPGSFEGQGIRFDYPESWGVEVGEDGSRVTISVTETGGTAFAIIALDTDLPTPASLADEALEAMRAEYPQLDAYPALEDIDGRRAVGHDVEFFALDFVNACVIRSFRSPRRTVLMLQQWSETADGPEMGLVFAAIRKSFHETDLSGVEEDDDVDWDGPDIEPPEEPGRSTDEPGSAAEPLDD